MIPKGKLIVIGGHEEKGEPSGENLDIENRKYVRNHFEILGMLISTIPRSHHIIEIVASASSIPEEMEAMYKEAYEAEGFSSVAFLRVEQAEDAQDPALVKRVQNAHVVFFTGGDQSKLIGLMGGTPLLDAVIKKYYADEHFIVGGTSAGAMAIPEITMTRGIIGSALYHDDITIANGLGLINNVIIDTHFIKRGRFARLAHAVALNPECLGIGLEENTALIISGAEMAECIGTGMAVIIDGTDMGETNIKEASDSTPIVMENLKVSIIAEGSLYSLKDRKMVTPIGL